MSLCSVQACGFIALRVPETSFFPAQVLAVLHHLCGSSRIAELALTEDAKEGRASFVEKRAPIWSGC